MSDKEGLADSVGAHKEQVNTLNARIDKLEAQLQATTDLTDDLLANANTLVTSVGDRVDVTMQQAELVLMQADTLVSVYLVFITVFVAISSAGISWFIGKKRDTYVREAVDEVVKKLSSNDDFQSDFIAKLAANKNIAENIDYAIQQAVKQQSVEGKDQDHTFQEVVDK